MAEYLKIPELSRRLDVSEKTARRYIKAGLLPSTFIGGAYRVTEEDLEEFFRAREVRPKASAPPEQEAEERRETVEISAGFSGSASMDAELTVGAVLLAFKRGDITLEEAERYLQLRDNAA